MLKQTIRISLELKEFKSYTILKILKYIDEFFQIYNYYEFMSDLIKICKQQKRF